MPLRLGHGIEAAPILPRRISSFPRGIGVVHTVRLLVPR
jgi:hypothetical protein